MSVSFTNEQINTPGFNEALNSLVEKPLPQATSWVLADLVEGISAQQKKFAQARADIVQRNGGIKDARGLWGFDAKHPVTEDAEKEFAELMVQTQEIAIEPIKLPDKDSKGQPIDYAPSVIRHLKPALRR